MNKLDKGIYDNVKDIYLEKMVPVVRARYEKFRDTHSTLFLNNSFDLKNIFESNCDIDDNKIEKLLVSHFDEMDENIKNYIKTCTFAYLTTNKVYQLNRDIKKYFNCQDSKEAVQKYLNSFRNTIIESYLETSKVYDTMKSLQKVCINLNEDLLKLNKQIEKFINYDYLYKEDLRDKIIITSGIDICPYCGRQFITRFKDRSSADLDHFFPKKYLPLLSLSLYNFIPSCQICNSRFKSQHIKKILYPFDDGYENNAIFNVKYKSPITKIRPVIEIQIENISKDKYFETSEDIKLFHIDEIYQSHNEFVADLLYRKHIYDNSTFKENINKLVPYDLDNEQMNILLFGYSFDLEKDQNKPLGKLVNDIYNLF